MPIYEFKCRSCTSISSFLVKGFALPEGLKCEKCGSTDIAKIVSRVNCHGSSNERLSSYDPRERKTDGFYRDSRNIGLEAERMLKRAGVDPGDDFKAKLEKVRTDPSSVLKDS